MNIIIVLFSCLDYSGGVRWTLQRMIIPDVTIFVRHSAKCKYREDETYRKCKCRKHLRWTANDSHGRPKQFRESAKTRTWSVAETRRDEIRAGYADGKPISPQETRQTIAEIGKLFLENKKNSGHSGAASMMKHAIGIERFVKFMETRSVTFPSQITDAHLEAYRSTWPALYEASVTRSQVQNRLLEFFRYCVNKRFAEHLPTLSKIKVTREQTQPLEPAEYEKLLASALVAFTTPEQGRKVAAVAACMRWSGLSIRDASCLKRSAIKEKNGVYRIKTKRTKTKIEVDVKIPPHIAKELLAVANGNPEYVFWNAKGGSEVTAAHHFGKWLKDAAAHAGVAGFHSHRLRDTFAVRMLEGGAPMEKVSKALGHKSIATTEGFYNAWNTVRQEGLDADVEKGWNNAR
jgi:integrase/recombinase XerD